MILKSYKYCGRRHKIRLEDSNLITVCEYHHKLAEKGTMTKDELLDIVQAQEEEKILRYTPSILTLSEGALGHHVFISRDKIFPHQILKFIFRKEASYLLVKRQKTMKKNL